MTSNDQSAADYRQRFKRCGQNVTVAPDVYIEHPEAIEVGDDVTLMRGLHWIGRPRVCQIGSGVTFYPNCFIQGSTGRLLVADHVEFFCNTYISLAGEAGFVDIDHHCHFAPNCALYGHGGLTIGPYCNIAAHTVFATVGHDPAVGDQPMALAPSKAGPITLVEDVWIAANVTITANTRIERGCVIGANAVVTRDTEPMGVYVGVPARRLRDRGR